MDRLVFDVDEHPSVSGRLLLQVMSGDPFNPFAFNSVGGLCTIHGALRIVSCSKKHAPAVEHKNTFTTSKEDLQSACVNFSFGCDAAKSFVRTTEYDILWDEKTGVSHGEQVMEVSSVDGSREEELTPMKAPTIQVSNKHHSCPTPPAKIPNDPFNFSPRAVGGLSAFGGLPSPAPLMMSSRSSSPRSRPEEGQISITNMKNPVLTPNRLQSWGLPPGSSPSRVLQIVCKDFPTYLPVNRVVLTMSLIAHSSTNSAMSNETLSSGENLKTGEKNCKSNMQDPMEPPKDVWCFHASVCWKMDNEIDWIDIPGALDAVIAIGGDTDWLVNGIRLDRAVLLNATVKLPRALTLRLPKSTPVPVESVAGEAETKKCPGDVSLRTDTFWLRILRVLSSNHGRVARGIVVLLCVSTVWLLTISFCRWFPWIREDARLRSIILLGIFTFILWAVFSGTLSGIVQNRALMWLAIFSDDKWSSDLLLFCSRLFSWNPNRLKLGSSLLENGNSGNGLTFFVNGWNTWSFAGSVRQGDPVPLHSLPDYFVRAFHDSGNAGAMRINAGQGIIPFDDSAVLTHDCTAQKCSSASTNAPMKVGMSIAEQTYYRDYIASDCFTVLANPQSDYGMVLGFLSQKQAFSCVSANRTYDRVSLHVSLDGIWLKDVTKKDSMVGELLFLDSDDERDLPYEERITHFDTLAMYTVHGLGDSSPLRPYTQLVRNAVMVEPLQRRIARLVPPGGWCSWYDGTYGSVNEETIQRASRRLRHWKKSSGVSRRSGARLDVILIDDGYATRWGDWSTLRVGFLNKTTTPIADGLLPPSTTIKNGMSEANSNHCRRFSSVTKEIISSPETCPLPNTPAKGMRPTRSRLSRVNDSNIEQEGRPLSVTSTVANVELIRLSQEIISQGLEPGIWLAPFVCDIDSHLASSHPDWILRNQRGRPVNSGHCGRFFYVLDASLPAVREFIHNCVIELIRDASFRYVKLDFLYAAVLSEGVFANQCMTRAEIFALAMNTISEAVFQGEREALKRAQTDYRVHREELLLVEEDELPSLRRTLHQKREALRRLRQQRTVLVANGAPLLAVAGHVSVARVSADTSSTWTPTFPLPAHDQWNLPCAQNMARQTASRLWSHRQLWLCDPDVHLSGSFSNDEWLTLLSIKALSGGSVIISEDLSSWSKTRRKQLESLFPPVYNAAEAIDLFSGGSPSLFRLVMHSNESRRKYGNVVPYSTMESTGTFDKGEHDKHVSVGEDMKVFSQAPNQRHFFPSASTDVVGRLRTMTVDSQELDGEYLSNDFECSTSFVPMILSASIDGYDAEFANARAVLLDMTHSDGTSSNSNGDVYSGSLSDTSDCLAHGLLRGRDGCRNDFWEDSLLDSDDDSLCSLTPSFYHAGSMRGFASPLSISSPTAASPTPSSYSIVKTHSFTDTESLRTPPFRENATLGTRLGSPSISFSRAGVSWREDPNAVAGTNLLPSPRTLTTQRAQIHAQRDALRVYRQAVRRRLLDKRDLLRRWYIFGSVNWEDKQERVVFATLSQLLSAAHIAEYAEYSRYLYKRNATAHARQQAASAANSDSGSGGSFYSSQASSVGCEHGIGEKNSLSFIFKMSSPRSSLNPVTMDGNGPVQRLSPRLQRRAVSFHEAHSNSPLSVSDPFSPVSQYSPSPRNGDTRLENPSRSFHSRSNSRKERNRSAYRSSDNGTGDWPTHVSLLSLQKTWRILHILHIFDVWKQTYEYRVVDLQVENLSQDNTLDIPLGTVPPRSGSLWSLHLSLHPLLPQYVGSTIHFTAGAEIRRASSAESAPLSIRERLQRFCSLAVPKHAREGNIFATAALPCSPVIHHLTLEFEPGMLSTRSSRVGVNTTPDGSNGLEAVDWVWVFVPVKLKRVRQYSHVMGRFEIGGTAYAGGDLNSNACQSSTRERRCPVRLVRYVEEPSCRTAGFVYAIPVISPASEDPQTPVNLTISWIIDVEETAHRVENLDDLL